MKWFLIAKRSALELRRDWGVLVMTLAFAPFFLGIYWLMSGGGAPTHYSLGIASNDSDEAFAQRLKSHLSEKLGQSGLQLSMYQTEQEAKKFLAKGQIDAFLVVPSGATEKAKAHEPVKLKLTGDLKNMRYVMTAIITWTGVGKFSDELQATPPPIQVEEVPLGGGFHKSDFDLYVPGLILASVLMMLFPVAMTITREVEKGTIQRLQVARISPLQYMVGAAVPSVVLSFGSAALTLVLAYALGYRSDGCLVLAIGILLLASLSVVGVGLLTACFCRTATEVAIYGSFPLLLMFFFSGAAMPMPQMKLFELLGHPIEMFDFLPAKHANAALGKVLSLGQGPGDVMWEIGWLVILTAAYVALGASLYSRRRLRATA